MFYIYTLEKRILRNGNMIHYIIEWTNGAKESIYGSNYINTLRLNGITPEMEHNIIDYETA